MHLYILSQPLHSRTPCYAPSVVASITGCQCLCSRIQTFPTQLCPILRCKPYKRFINRDSLVICSLPQLAPSMCCIQNLMWAQLLNAFPDEALQAHLPRAPKSVVEKGVGRQVAQDHVVLSSAVDPAVSVCGAATHVRDACSTSAQDWRRGG